MCSVTQCKCKYQVQMQSQIGIYIKLKHFLFLSYILDFQANLEGKYDICIFMLILQSIKSTEKTVEGEGEVVIV